MGWNGSRTKAAHVQRKTLGRPGLAKGAKEGGGPGLEAPKMCLRASPSTGQHAFGTAATSGAGAGQRNRRRWSEKCTVTTACDHGTNLGHVFRNVAGQKRPQRVVGFGRCKNDRFHGGGAGSLVSDGFRSTLGCTLACGNAGVDKLEEPMDSVVQCGVAGGVQSRFRRRRKHGG